MTREIGIDVARSMGKMYTRLYDKSGRQTGEPGHAEYTHILGKDAQEERKLDG